MDITSYSIINLWIYTSLTLLWSACIISELRARGSPRGSDRGSPRSSRRSSMARGTSSAATPSAISTVRNQLIYGMWLYVMVCGSKGGIWNQYMTPATNQGKCEQKMLRRNWSSCYLSSVACFNVTPGSIIPSKTIQGQMIRFLRCLDALVMPAFLFFVIVALVELQVQMTYLYSLAATGQKAKLVSIIHNTFYICRHIYFRYTVCVIYI